MTESENIKDVKRKTRTIAKHNGRDHQLRKLAEETEELLNALKESNYKMTDHVLEEIVDVNIVISQFNIELLSSHERELRDNIREYKLDRQMIRMKHENEGASNE